MGKKVEPKMVPTKVSVRAFVDGLADERRRREATALISMMKKVTGERPVMWGPSIIGFGRYHYQYASGREGDAPRAGFSPRSAALTVYCMPGFAAQRTLLSRLGPHKTSVSCLYIRRLDDVDTDVLTAIVERSFDEVNERYPRSGVDGAPAPTSRARRGTSRTGERRKRRESKSR